MDRGTFFHTIYRIQQKLGREFADLQPYALYPPSEYFHGAVTGREQGPTPVPPQRQAGRPAGVFAAPFRVTFGVGRPLVSP